MVRNIGTAGGTANNNLGLKGVCKEHLEIQEEVLIGRDCIKGLERGFSVFHPFFTLNKNNNLAKTKSRFCL